MRVQCPKCRNKFDNKSGYGETSCPSCGQRIKLRQRHDHDHHGDDDFLLGVAAGVLAESVFDSSSSSSSSSSDSYDGGGGDFGGGGSSGDW